MKVKKICALLLSAAMLFAAAGCGKKAETGNANANVDTHLTSVDSATGKFAYTIVRPKNTDMTVLDDLAKEVRKSLKEAFDVTVPMKYDSATKDYDGNLEILIGDTDREESATTLQELKDNRVASFGDFIVKVTGDKICINAQNDQTIELAVEFFIDTFCKDSKSWNLLYDGYKFIYEGKVIGGNSMVADIPLASYTIIHPRDMELIYGNPLTELNDYLSEKQGYLLKTADDRTKETEYEVLVGDVNRDASKEIKVEGDNYIIKVVGKKLVIKGGSSLALMQALKDLKQMFSDAGKSGGLTFESDFEKTGTYSSENKGYTYVWGDEFNSGSINHYWWVDGEEFKYGKTFDSCLGGKAISKSTENVIARDGCMVLFNDRLSDKDTTMCHASTYGTMAYRYGMIEIRAKLSPGPATTSFFLYSNHSGYGSFTEFDLLENFGKPDSFASNLHRFWNLDVYFGHTSFDIPQYREKKKYKFTDSTDKALSDSFHIYSMEWTDSLVSMAVDGKPFFTYSLDDDENVDVRRLPINLYISCRLGDANYGSAVTLDDPTHYETLVDYVRIYQRNDIDSQIFTRDKNNVPNYTGTPYKYEYH